MYVPMGRMHQSIYADFILAVLVYGVLFMDWGEMAGRQVAPFAGVCIVVMASYMGSANGLPDPRMVSRDNEFDMDSKSQTAP